jgi:selenocysteine-specific elongation factor
MQKAVEILDALVKEGKAAFFAGKKKIIHQSNFIAGKQKVVDFFKKYHLDNPLETGISRIEAGRELRLDSDLFDELLSSLVNEKSIIEEKNKLRSKDHSVKLNDGEKQLKEKVNELYLSSGFSTPRQDELPVRFSVAESKISEIMNLLFDEGILARLPQDVVMHRNCISEAKEIIVKHIRNNGELDSAFFKIMIKSTRKYALALLDYFDEQGLTVRYKNIRKLK